MSYRVKTCTWFAAMAMLAGCSSSGSEGTAPPSGDASPQSAESSVAEAKSESAVLLRSRRDLFNWIKMMLSLQPFPQKHSPSLQTQIICLSPAIPPQQEGVS